MINSFMIILSFSLIVILLLLWLTVCLIAKLLVGIATDRKPIKFSIKNDNLARITKDPNFVNLLAKKSEALEAQNTKQVEISAPDGVRLVGHILSSNSPRRIIIAVHGWRGSWCRDFGIVSDFWFSSDATVIYIEQRGQRESGGDYITFGILERYDILEWVKWVTLHFSGLPIYLCGVSMGASSVLMSSSLGLDERVHGIIADSGFTSPSDIWSYFLRRNFRIPYRLCMRAANRECKRRIGQPPDSCSTLNALKECHIPVLFIHGADDSFVPPEMTYLNFSACNSPKKLYVVPGANHCMGYYLDPEGYENEMREFFRLYD